MANLGKFYSTVDPLVKVLSNLPPELFNLLRHIPPPVIGQQQQQPGGSGPDQRQSFQPRFPSSTSPPQKQATQAQHQTYQPTTNNTNPKFDKFEPFR